MGIANNKGISSFYNTVFREYTKGVILQKKAMPDYLLVTSLFFVLIGALHLLRALSGWPVLIGAYPIPRAFSLLAALVAFLLAFWGFSELF